MTLDEAAKNNVSFEKFSRILNYLLENAALDHDIRKFMTYNGYNYDEITDNDIKKFTEKWEKQMTGGYTWFKVEQGVSYCFNNLLKRMIDEDVLLPSLEDSKDQILYSCYQSEVCNDLMKKFFHTKYGSDIENEKFIMGVIDNCKTFLEPDTDFVNDEKFCNAISDIFEKNKKHFLKLDDFNELYDNESTVDQTKNKIDIIRSFIKQNNIEFPGKDYYKIYDFDKDNSFVKDRSNYSDKELVASVKLLSDRGIELTREQADKLGLPVIKSREKIDNNISIMKDDIKILNDVRFEWENSPTHVDNVRSEEIKKTRELINELIELSSNESLDDEQLAMLNGYLDFMEYSRDVNETNIGPMSDDVRGKMQEFYNEQENSIKNKR